MNCEFLVKIGSSAIVFFYPGSTRAFSTFTAWRKCLTAYKTFAEDWGPPILSTSQSNQTPTQGWTSRENCPKINKQNQKNQLVKLERQKNQKMWSSSKKSVDLTRFESKSSGLDSGAGSDRSSSTSSLEKIPNNGGSQPNSICIVGSGDFGRALALRMVQSGYTVNIGSRNPERNR